MEGQEIGYALVASTTTGVSEILVKSATLVRMAKNLQPQLLKANQGIGVVPLAPTSTMLSVTPVRDVTYPSLTMLL
jgi:hypothetical protein